ncbi:NADP-dependent oxidoreductase [Blastococcus montanus]|uniref:NADP-dependent oxidoreductase n=1 Tax=Blastococcus montanus TaxID=3144973 RepID=UPI003207CEDD
MRAITLHRPGGPDALLLDEVHLPGPGPGEVRVRVAAAGVNPVDLQTRSGVYHRLGWVSVSPVGLGWDLAGAVDAVGAGVPLAEGTPVAALSPGVDKPLGAYAEFLVLPADCVTEIDPALDPVVAATVPLNSLTAMQALDLMGPAAGRSLLITGAAGAVGGYATQLAAERGFTVTGLARPTDEAFLADLGSGHAVTVRPAAFDVVLDAAALGVAALDAVADGGSYVGVVPPAVPDPVRSITTTAVLVTPDAKQLAEAVRRTTDGSLPARVHSIAELSEAAQAHRTMEGGGLRGRIVLTV